MNAKTYTVRESDIERRWYVVDATDETLGRLASRIARILEGKHKAAYVPHLDSGDHVIVTNAARIAVTALLFAAVVGGSVEGHTCAASGAAALCPCSPTAEPSPAPGWIRFGEPVR